MKYLAVATLVILAGCVTASPKYTALSSETHAAVPASSVEVFQTKRPSRDYTELGIVTFRAGTAVSASEAIDNLRNKAAEMGADGLILQGADAGPSMIMTGGLIATLKDYKAVAIKYK